jgi:hypothetical protein
VLCEAQGADFCAEGDLETFAHWAVGVQRLQEGGEVRPACFRLGLRCTGTTVAAVGVLHGCMKGAQAAIGGAGNSFGIHVGCL